MRFSSLRCCDSRRTARVHDWVFVRWTPSTMVSIRPPNWRSCQPFGRAYLRRLRPPCRQYRGHTRDCGARTQRFACLILRRLLVARRGEWRGMSLPSDVNVDTVTYGGLVNVACHGTGKTQARRCCPRCKRSCFMSHKKTKNASSLSESEQGIVSEPHCTSP